MKSAGKAIATFFWDARGIIYIDYLEKEQTITKAYNVSLLQRLSEEIMYSPNLAPSDFFYFQTWKNGLADNGSRRTRRSSPKQMPILRAIQNPTFWTA